MRFYYVTLAVVATLLSSTNAIHTDGETNQITKTAPKIVGTTQMGGTVKRLLRVPEEEKDSFDPLDDNEERGGVNVKELTNLAQSKKGVLPVAMDNLSASLQSKIVNIMIEQNISQKRFASKLGLSSVDDMANRNAAFFKTWREYFRENKKPKKIPEDFIGGR